MRNERDGAYDSERWRCAWSDGRERCHFPGVCSHGTRGEGPWYCSWHFSCGDGATGQRFIEQSRDYVQGQPVPRRPLKDPSLTAPPAVRLPYADDDREQPPERVSESE